MSFLILSSPAGCQEICVSLVDDHCRIYSVLSVSLPSISLCKHWLHEKQRSIDVDELSICLYTALNTSSQMQNCHVYLH